MNMMNKMFYILLLSTLLIAEDESTGSNIYYFTPGPNLVSFNILPEDTNIENIFSDIENNLISIITEGQISHHIEDNWVGTLTDIDNMRGYWIIVSEISLLDIEGNIHEPEIYFLNPGAHLISYPYAQSQQLTDAIPYYMFENLYAIIGENSAAIFSNGNIFGSLTEFEPKKGYWFFINNAVPFEYNTPLEQFSTVDYSASNDVDFVNPYNQSTQQSIFFIDEAFYNGNILDVNYNISVFCNNNAVGGKAWNGPMTDIIAMGDDGYEFTQGYCETDQDIHIEIRNEDLVSSMHITGNEQWSFNTINTISISNIETGDVNLNGTINVTDIIIIIEHIIEANTIINLHQLFLSDINNDSVTNITDIIALINLIIA